MDQGIHTPAPLFQIRSIKPVTLTKKPSNKIQGQLDAARARVVARMSLTGADDGPPGQHRRVLLAAPDVAPGLRCGPGRRARAACSASRSDKVRKCCSTSASLTPQPPRIRSSPFAGTPSARPEHTVPRVDRLLRVPQLVRQAIREVLSHPVYAGACIPVGAQRSRLTSRSDWRVFLPGHHDGYVNWETYEANLERLKANRPPNLHAGSGVVREGAAPLQ